MKTKRRIKVLISPVLTFGVTFMILACIGVFFLICFVNDTGDTSPIIIILFDIALLGSALIVFLGTIRFCYSIITIDERGIRRSAVGFLFKLEMKWDEIKEISYQSWFFPYIWITKDRPIGLVKSNSRQVFKQLYKRKDLIQIHLSRKIYKTIRQYTEIPIIGLTEETMKELKLEK